MRSFFGANEECCAHPLQLGWVGEEEGLVCQVEEGAHSQLLRDERMRKKKVWS